MLAFVALVAVQHLLRDDLPPARHFVSEYARGSTAPVQVVAFLAWAAAMLACAGLARRALPPGRRISRALVVLGLGVAALGALVAALFATQTVAGELPAGAVRTTGGRLHDLGTLGVLSGLLLAAVSSVRLVRAWRYRGLVALLAVMLVAIVPVLVAAGIDAPGVGQRGFILVGCLWLLAFAGFTPAA